MPGPEVHVDADWLRDAYVARGLSLSQAAAEAATSISTIRRRMKLYGIASGAPGGHSDRRDPMLPASAVLSVGYLAEARRRGLSASKIGEESGVDPSTVRRRLRALGLRVGPPSPKVDVDADAWPGSSPKESRPR